MKRRRGYAARQWFIALVERSPIDIKKRLLSISWSGSSHFLGLVILFLYTFPVEVDEPMVIQMSFAATMDDASMELETMDETLLELEPVVEEAEEVEAILPVEIPIPAEALESLPALSVDSTLGEALNNSDVTIDAASTEVDHKDSRVVELNRRVKQAGGGLVGPVRVSLMWESSDDLDLHLSYEPKGRPNPRTIYADRGYVWFGQPVTVHARLDVDANARFLVRSPCENIVFRTVPKKANYLIAVNLYAKRSGLAEVPYTVLVQYGNKSLIFEGNVKSSNGMKEIHRFSNP